MTKARIDRRVARTRAAIQKACLALALKKGHEAVTVRDICKAADVGRSTFYLHFSDKDAVHRAGMEDLRKQLRAHPRQVSAQSGAGRQDRLSFARPMLEHARQHVDLYRVAVGGRGGGATLAHIHKILADLVREELALPAGKKAVDSVPDELAVQHIVGAFMAVMRWWLDDGARLGPERVDEMFRRLALHGVAAAYPMSDGIRS